MLIEESEALAPDGRPYFVVILRNKAGTEIRVMDWGATWLSCRFPLNDGTYREVLLGCKTVQEYPQQSAYLGASVGRYANRIAHATLKYAGHTIRLEANQGEHQLHGGSDGFSHRRWGIIQQSEQQVTFELYSPDGDQGFPGNVVAKAYYTLTEDNRIEIRYHAETDKPCPVNMTNHAYFNLDGDEKDIRAHTLQLFADHYLPIESDGIPLHGPESVAGSGMDFRHPKLVSQDFLKDEAQTKVKGYDHAYLLQNACHHCDQPAAHVWSADKKVQLTVYTTAPALQFYSGNFLGGTPARLSSTYLDYSGLALESEFLPDSPNHPEWPQPDCWLKPGKVYSSLTVYHLIAL